MQTKINFLHICIWDVDRSMQDSLSCADGLCNASRCKGREQKPTPTRIETGTTVTEVLAVLTAAF